MSDYYKAVVYEYMSGFVYRQGRWKLSKTSQANWIREGLFNFCNYYIDTSLYITTLLYNNSNTHNSYKIAASCIIIVESDAKYIKVSQMPLPFMKPCSLK